MYSNDYSYSSGADSMFGLAFLGGFLVFALLAYVVTAFLMGRIFAKAGVEAWKAWVPVYNSWVFLELGGQKGWISLLLLAGAIPFIGIIGTIVATVYLCIAAYHIGLKFGKEGWWVAIYLLAGIVWLGILAFDDSKWGGTSQRLADQEPSDTPPSFQPPQAPTES